MSKTKPLTSAENAWLDDLQSLLRRCPSKRIGFFTIGDNSVFLHDATREADITHELDENGGEWATAAARAKADFGGVTIEFPNAVHSTAG